MSAHPIELSDFRDGVDRKSLTQLRDRFLVVNHGRLERWQAGVGDRQRQFLTLLPLLLHVNHPMMPGYVSGQCPSTLHGYQPSEDVLHEAKLLARSFQFVNRPRAADILSVFLMGSCGTIAQAPGSDLDLWICVRDDLSESGRASLEKKLEKLSQWGQSLGVDAHFFIMSAEAFRRGERAGITVEDCGSTQHYLLLDEFYRSSLLVAGCFPVWWLCPSELEREFDVMTSILRDRRYIRAADTIDFGGVSDIPAGEFVGAGLWQLYKGIDSPYKAVLKILLTEVYASEFPNVDCISLEFKRAVYSGAYTLNSVDPYVLLYRKVEAYLLDRDEKDRLELARECFYFKVNEPLSRVQPRVRWKRELLEAMVKEWGWDESRINRLDARDQWKIKPVMEVHQKLVGELTHSYRILSSFARNEVEENADQRQREEMALLGRRLHAAFERKAGKLERVNPNIASSLHESVLVLVRKVNDEGKELWGLYPGQVAEFRADRALKLAASAAELVAWSYFNGLATTATQFQAVQATVSRQEVQEATQVLSENFPERMQAVDSNYLSQTAAPRSVILFINFGVDSAGMLAKRGLARVSQQNNALSYGGLQEDLVVSVDVVCVNTWQEVMVARFAQGQPLLAALRYIMQQMPAAYAGSLPKVIPVASAEAHAGSLVQRVREVITDVLTCYYGARQPDARYVIQSGTGYFVLSLENWQLRFVRCPDVVALYECLSKPQTRFSPLTVDQKTLSGSPLPLMVREGEPNAVRIFYRAVDEHRTEVWVFDENNALLHLFMEVRDLELMVPLRRFLRSVTERQKAARELDLTTNNIPPDPRLLWFEVVGRGPWQLQARQIPAGYQDRKFLHVQGLAYLGESGVQFNLVCSGQEFNAAVYGETLYDEVASHIASQRESGEHYPVYVTDLDLTALQADPCQPIATITYLHYKAQLEERLTAALRRKTDRMLNPPLSGS